MVSAGHSLFENTVYHFIAISCLSHNNKARCNRDGKLNEKTGNWMKRLRLCPCISPAHTSSTPRVPPSGRRYADSQACQWHPDWSNCRGSVREFPWNSRRSCWSYSRSTPCKKSSKFLIILPCPFILHHDWEQSWILSLSYYKAVLRRGQANTKNIRSDFFTTNTEYIKSLWHGLWSDSVDFRVMSRVMSGFFRAKKRPFERINPNEFAK